MATQPSGFIPRSAERDTVHRAGAEDTADCLPPPIKRPDLVGASAVVVGLGNEIASDDAVGILAARRLRRLLAGNPRVEVIELPWAGLSLLEALCGYQSAFLIDSLRSGRNPPGRVIRLTEDDLAGSVRLNSFHDMNYATAMAFGRSLGWPLPSRVEIYAVEGQSFDEFGMRLTPAVCEGLEEVVNLVAARLGVAAQGGAAVCEQEVADDCSG